MSTLNANMEAAPKDRRILVLTENEGWCHRVQAWRPYGRSWVEAWWVEAENGRPAEFILWCGDRRTRSTDILYPVAWAEVPEET